MAEGRYLLGVTPPADAQAFLAPQGAAIPPGELGRLGLLAATRRRRRLLPERLWEPLPEAFSGHIAAVAARPLFKGIYDGARTSFGAVPPAHLIPVQPQVDFTFAASTAARAATEEAALALCLPAAAESIAAWGHVSQDPGGPSFVVVSPDLNLKVTEMRLLNGDALRLAVTVSKTAVFVCAVECRGRLYLKDGTHRAVGLADRGAPYIPAVILHADGDDSLIPRHLTDEALFGDAPPSVVDFVTPGLYISHPWQPLMKVIRLRPDAFTVPSQAGMDPVV